MRIFMMMRFVDGACGAKLRKYACYRAGVWAGSGLAFYVAVWDVYAKCTCGTRDGSVDA